MTVVARDATAEFDHARSALARASQGQTAPGRATATDPVLRRAAVDEELRDSLALILAVFIPLVAFVLAFAVA